MNEMLRKGRFLLEVEEEYWEEDWKKEERNRRV
jgi:hypothetical protein